MAVVYASFEEAIKEMVVRELTETRSRALRMANEFYKKQCHVWGFYSAFYISSALLIGYLQVILELVRTTFACLLPLVHLQFRLAYSKFPFN